MQKDQNDHVAHASITVGAARENVWKALVDPDAIKEYMFGATVVSDWHKGSPIVWKGEFKGKAFEDKGEVLVIDPPRKLSYSHYSPLEGKPESPETTHVVTIELSGDAFSTDLHLTQSNNATDEARAESEKNWSMMLEGLEEIRRTMNLRLVAPGLRRSSRISPMPLSASLLITR